MKGTIRGIALILPVIAMLVLAAHAQTVKAGTVVNEAPDLVVVDVAPSKTIVGQGYGLQVDVTISNLGGYQGALNVTLYANETTIATFTGETPPSGALVTIHFSWDTTSYAMGSYILSAYAEPVPNETNTTNNYFAGGRVVVARAGDLTGGAGNAWSFVPDGNVDLKDVALVIKHFYSLPGDENWSSNCDINNDGRVDSKDIAVIAKNFGHTQDSVSSFKAGIYVYSWNFGEYDTQTIASHFDISQSCFVSGDTVYAQKIATVKSLNPNYKALMYQDVGAIDGSDSNWQTAKNNNWLLKHADGTYITQRAYPSLHLLDIANPNYQTWIANLIKTRLDANSLFDGIMADCGFSTNVQGFEDWQTSNPAINPRTGAPFTTTELMTGYLGLHTAIKNAIGSKIMLVNGIWTGASFFGDNYNEVIDCLSESPVNGFLSEGCWYQGSQFMTEANWLKSLNFGVWMQDNWLMNHPERIFGETCGSGLQWTMPSGCTNEQMMLYGYCSALLGVKYPLQNIVDFAFHSSADTAMLQLTQKMHDLDLVSPLGDYYKITSTSVYARDFVKCRVLVNPTGSQYTVPLNETYTNFYDNNTVSSSILVPAHTGWLLLKQ